MKFNYQMFSQWKMYIDLNIVFIQNNENFQVCQFSSLKRKDNNTSNKSIAFNFQTYDLGILKQKHKNIH